MKSYTEALALIEASVAPLPAESRALPDLAGATTARTVRSRMDVPPFANAAMDGFALRSADIAAAGEERPAQLEVTGIVAAGDPPGAAPPAGTAVEIMTGAPMPADCDAVIPIERVETDTDQDGRVLRVRITEALRPGRNVRMAGEDFERDDRVLARSRLIEPHHVMALAATGSDRVECHAAPRIAVITTGSELAERGAPADSGMIRNANGPYLESFVAHIGAVQSRRVNVADRPAELVAAIESSREAADVILTTGGVSAGRYDLIPDAIERAGGEVIFHKLAIRPGKPLLFARLADGTLMFGLPGNPIAAAVGLRFFVVPALRRLQGLPPERFQAAVSQDRIHKRAGLSFFGKARADVDADARLRVHLLHGQESFKIQPLTESNCWVIVPDGPEVIEPDDLVQVAPLYPTSFLQD